VPLSRTIPALLNRRLARPADEAIVEPTQPTTPPQGHEQDENRSEAEPRQRSDPPGAEARKGDREHGREDRLDGKDREGGSPGLVTPDPSICPVIKLPQPLAHGQIVASECK